MAVDARIAGLGGQAALPRRNGELVFNAPWEGRVFGMAVALTEKGLYPWDEFRARLIDVIAEGGSDYYVNWLAAFQTLLLARGVVTAAEIHDRAAEYRALVRDPVF